MSLAECNCDLCAQSCVMYQKLKEQNIEGTPDIMNTLREMFLAEFQLRDSAIRAAPRFYEITPTEYNDILSNQEHYRQDESGEIIAIY